MSEEKKRRKRRERNQPPMPPTPPGMVPIPPKYQKVWSQLEQAKSMGIALLDYVKSAENSVLNLIKKEEQEAMQKAMEKVEGK